MGSTEGLMEAAPRMTGSSTSLGSKDMASAVSLYEQLSSSSKQDNLDSLSMRAVYDVDSEGDSISRPLSRGSVTSGVSMMATKDGVDGERVKKLGIPQYPLNLLNTMAHTQYKKVHGGTTCPRRGSNSNGVSKAQLSQSTADSPNSPPMTLREKMRLLGNDVNSTDMIDETLLCDESAAEKYRSTSNNNSFHADGHTVSEIDSNSSTMGDDTSFQNLSNLSPVMGTVYSERDPFR